MERNQFYTEIAAWIKKTLLLTSYEQEFVIGYSEQLDVMDMNDAKLKVTDYAINFLRECKCRELCIH